MQPASWYTEYKYPILGKKETRKTKCHDGITRTIMEMRTPDGDKDNDNGLPTLELRRDQVSKYIAQSSLFFPNPLVHWGCP
jgi:hypothetical protein